MFLVILQNLPDIQQRGFPGINNIISVLDIICVFDLSGPRLHAGLFQTHQAPTGVDDDDIIYLLHWAGR